MRVPTKAQVQAGIQQHSVVSVQMDLSWSSNRGRGGQPLGRQKFLRTVVSSNYHNADGMQSEATVIFLDTPKSWLIFEKAYPEARGATTQKFVALQANGEKDVSTIYNCVLNYELQMLHA